MDVENKPRAETSFATAEILGMKVHLDYGRQGLDVELPEANVVKIFRYRPAPPLPDPRSAVRDVLEDPVATPPLEELARGRRSACIAVCDITRPVPNELILSEMLPIVERAGIPRENILILIATGLHRPNQGSELIEILGPEIPALPAWKIITGRCSKSTFTWARVLEEFPCGSTGGG